MFKISKYVIYLFHINRYNVFKKTHNYTQLQSKQEMGA